MQATLANAKTDARKAALLRMQRAVAGAGGASFAGAENTLELFDSEEQALMASGE